MESIPSTGTLGGKPYIFGHRYKFKIDHSFHGKASEVAEVSSGNGGGDCGYRFEVGGRYIVFAYGSDHLGTGICGMTAQWTEEFAKKLDQQAHSSEKTARVFGKVSMREGKNANDVPLGGITVVLDPDDKPKKTLTDAQGGYELVDLSPGDHILRMTAPQGSKANWSTKNPPENEETVKIHLEASGCLQRNFLAMTNGQVSGIFLDHSGGVVAGDSLGALPSEVELVSADSSDQQTFYSASVNKKDGTFTVDGVPEGRYLLTHNVVSGTTVSDPFLPTYFPGFSNRDAAAVINLHHGEHVGGLRMRSGERLKATQFDVVVTSGDNLPLPDANVWNVSTDTAFLRKSWNLSFAKTDQSGHARLTGFAGQSEEVNSYWNCTKGRGQLQGKTLSVVDGGAQEAVRVVLRGDCKNN